MKRMERKGTAQLALYWVTVLCLSLHGQAPADFVDKVRITTLFMMVMIFQQYLFLVNTLSK